MYVLYSCFSSQIYCKLQLHNINHSSNSNINSSCSSCSSSSQRQTASNRATMMTGGFVSQVYIIAKSSIYFKLQMYTIYHGSNVLVKLWTWLARMLVAENIMCNFNEFFLYCTV